MTEATINGTRLSYEWQGNVDKPILVLTHSLAWDREMFEELVSRLAGDWHILLIDLHGHGKSGHPPAGSPPLTLEGMAEDCAGLLQSLGIGSVHWAGLSMGGMVGMRLCVSHPELVRSLILMDTSAQPETPERVSIYMQLASALRNGLGAQIADSVLPFYFCQNTVERQPDLLARYRHKLARIADLEGVYQAALAVFGRGDFSQRLSDIHVPTLVLVGTEDISTPLDRAQHLSQGIPGAELITIPAAGHMSATEQPEFVATAVRDFLNSLPQTLPSQSQESSATLHDLTANTLEGLPQRMDAYQGKVVLVVNTASECGYTPQYEGLEDLYREYLDKGLVVMGFPSNDFGSQEPGSAEQIRSFCSTRFNVTFPMFAKVQTKGAGQSPVYKFLSAQHGEPQWNFHKYLVGKDGRVRKAFSSRVSPASQELRDAIDTALAE